MDHIQQIQSSEYQFPYHYIPRFTSDQASFMGSLNWPFGLSYMTALSHVRTNLDSLKPRNHIDIGCGDGALVNLLSKSHPNVQFAGIDYDERAIAWAKMFNPNIPFFMGSILETDTGRQWESASLIEVIEHIEAALLPQFISGVHGMLKPDATLIVTVPHKNKPLNPKHYQHFTFDTLKDVFSSKFEIVNVFGFEFNTVFERAIRRLVQSDVFYVESSFLNKVRLQYQLSRQDVSESSCGRIFMLLTPK